MDVIVATVKAESKAGFLNLIFYNKSKDSRNWQSSNVGCMLCTWHLALNSRGCLSIQFFFCFVMQRQKVGREVLLRGSLEG